MPCATLFSFLDFEKSLSKSLIAFRLIIMSFPCRLLPAARANAFAVRTIFLICLPFNSCSHNFFKVISVSHVGRAPDGPFLRKVFHRSCWARGDRAGYLIAR